MLKSVSIFGSTGSIGKNTVSLIAANPQRHQVIALAAKKDAETLANQAILIRPKYAVIADEACYLALKFALKDHPEIEVLAGLKALNQIAQIKCDLFISAIVGIEALTPTLKAIQSGSNIGLANKECLVAAGELILKEAKKHKVQIIPIDSEHNAIFQIWHKEPASPINTITLTASGGPLLHTPKHQLETITPKQALKHPNWSMGAKISIDSATMMNKALELIEAYHLFPVKKHQIKILIHPESIIHGLVNYQDGSSLAVLSLPDMRIPIAFALFYPERTAIVHQELNLASFGSLNFLEADFGQFPALKLAYNALEAGGNAPCILNAANEIAVERFLNNQIKFTQIIEIVMEVLEKIPYNFISSFEEAIFYNDQAKLIARNIQ